MTGLLEGAKGLLDKGMDVTVVPGFSRIGYSLRKSMFGWDGQPVPDLTGRTAVVTGATSGLGAAAAASLATMGADVWVIGRDQNRGAEVVAGIVSDGGSASFHEVDLSDLGQVRDLGEQLAELPALDVLVNNAGALVHELIRTPQGLELTAAVHVAAPHLLSTLALPALRRSQRPRVVTVTSGGMYSQALELDWLDVPPTPFDGVKLYANAKRAQVVLNRRWAREVPDVRWAAMHPGWADTPGVAQSLPAFRKLTRPILRTAAQGADTAVWLAAAQRDWPSGEFWSDREVRSTTRLPGTATSDTEADALWEWVQAAVTRTSGQPEGEQ